MFVLPMIHTLTNACGEELNKIPTPWTICLSVLAPLMNRVLDSEIWTTCMFWRPYLSYESVYFWCDLRWSLLVMVWLALHKATIDYRIWYVTLSYLLHSTFIIMALYHLHPLRLILLWKYKTPISFDWQVFLLTPIGIHHWKALALEVFCCAKFFWCSLMNLLLIPFYMEVEITMNWSQLKKPQCHKSWEIEEADGRWFLLTLAFP